MLPWVDDIHEKGKEIILPIINVVLPIALEVYESKYIKKKYMAYFSFMFFLVCEFIYLLKADACTNLIVLVFFLLALKNKVQIDKKLYNIGVE